MINTSVAGSILRSRKLSSSEIGHNIFSIATDLSGVVDSYWFVCLISLHSLLTAEVLLEQSVILTSLFLRRLKLCA